MLVTEKKNTSCFGDVPKAYHGTCRKTRSSIVIAKTLLPCFIKVVQRGFLNKNFNHQTPVYRFISGYVIERRH